MPTWLFIVLEIAVIGCGVVCGIFLAFSDFVMRSLGKAKITGGIEVMQIINREVFRSLFVPLLWAMLATSIGLAAYAYFYLAGAASHLVLAGAALYVAGVLVVTFGFNVPMNEQLDQLDCDSSEAAKYWTGTFLPRWTAWNYVRAIASGGAAVCYLLACIRLSQQL